jgi:glycosyltransferase involved in cell wall biosynthesis
MKHTDLFVSIVAVVQDHAAILPGFLDEVVNVLQRQCNHYEIVLVDDGATDESIAVLGLMLKRHACVRLIRLSRRYGLDVATTAGIESTIGEYVVVLQPESDPPAEIERMVGMLQEGVDVIQGVAENEPKEGTIFRACQWTFHALCRRLLGAPVPSQTATFLGFSRRALNAITRVRHKHRPLALLGCRIGFPRKVLNYRKVYRAGAPPRRRSLWQALDRGVATLVTNTVSPLRIITFVGCGAGLLNLLYCFYVIGINLFKREVAEGWTTLSLQISLMFLCVFVILASMAEYLSRVLEETKDQPLYHLLEEQGSATVSIDPATRNVTTYPSSGPGNGNQEDFPHAA